MRRVRQKLVMPAPKGCSCMADDCEQKTGGPSKLYCPAHEERSKRPEHKVPSTVGSTSDLARQYSDDVKDQQVDDFNLTSGDDW